MRQCLYDGDIFLYLAFLLFYIGGSPQMPELQVGQLTVDELDALELWVENREISLLGFAAWHLGQFKEEPSSPMDWRTSNLSPHLVHWYS